MALTVSLSKEFDKHYISWDGFRGGWVAPPTLALPTSVYTSSDFFNPGLTSHQDVLVFQLSLAHGLPASQAQAEPTAAFWQASSCWFLSLMFNLALKEKFCFPSCLLLKYVLTSAFSLLLCCLSGRWVLFLIQRQLDRMGKAA